MNPYIEELKRQLTENPPRVGDGDPILTMLYESYSDANRMDDDRIKTDFHELYQAMNGMQLREKDRITDSVCTIGAFTQSLRLEAIMYAFLRISGESSYIWYIWILR